MVLIKPPMRGKAIRILEEIQTIINLPEVKKKFEKWIDMDKDDSARRINSGRLEIFLKAEGKSSAAFDTIVGKLLEPCAKDTILEYAQRQARKDCRLPRGHQFGNFSLIVSYGGVAAQHPHIDLVDPNHQFGLVVTGGTDSTQFLGTGGGQRSHSPGSVAEVWQGMMGDSNPNSAMSPELLGALEKAFEKVPDEFKHFGNLLLPPKHLQDNMEKLEGLDCGALISLPGSVVHAAPAAMSNRAMIFFSSCPDDGETPEYDPDDQYTGVTFIERVIRWLWNKGSLGKPDKMVLLGLMEQYVVQREVKDKAQFEHSHLPEGELRGFVKQLEKFTLSKGNGNAKWKANLFEKMAKCSKLKA